MLCGYEQIEKPEPQLYLRTRCKGTQLCLTRLLLECAKNEQFEFGRLLVLSLSPYTRGEKNIWKGQGLNPGPPAL